MLVRLWLKNPLVYPGDRLPGFDPSHPASKGIALGRGISAIPVGANFINLLSGKPGTIGGTPTGGVHPAMGPFVRFATGAASSRFASQSTINDSSITFAAIVNIGTITAATFFQTSTANNGVSFGLDGTNGFYLAFNGSNAYRAGFVPAANTPYFIAISARATGATTNGALVQLNLINGSLRTSSPAIAAGSSSPNGTYTIGGDWAGDPTGNASVAAIVFAPTFVALPQLLQWAADPFSFWYPPRVEQIIGLSLARSQIILPPPKLGTWIVNQY